MSQALGSEGEKSSTWRELSATDYALKSFLPIVKGSYLKWFSDSQTAVRIDLFRLYILFSQYRSCDDTQEI